MGMTARELWTAFHGMALGAGFLLAFSDSVVSLWSLRADWQTSAGAAAGSRCVVVGTWAMALLGWLTVGVGTFAIYPM